MLVTTKIPDTGDPSRFQMKESQNHPIRRSHYYIVYDRRCKWGFVGHHKDGCRLLDQMASPLFATGLATILRHALAILLGVSSGDRM